MVNNLFTLVFFFSFCVGIPAQKLSNYTSFNLHSHNDYYQAQAFWQAYQAGFGSVEADVFYQNKSFVVAHTETEILSENTLARLYLEPLRQVIRQNGGLVFKDQKNPFQLLIELKQNYHISLTPLEFYLKENYPDLVNNPNLRLVLTGNIPPSSEFHKYSTFLWFDGDINKEYTLSEQKRIAMYSADLKTLTRWNGKGILRDEERQRVEQKIQNIHNVGGKVRFWNTPDFVNAWLNLMKLGVDYINTDRISDMSRMMKMLPKSYFYNLTPHTVYTPTYVSDAQEKAPKNIILLIPDGASLPQFYAAYTANYGNLNLFKMKQTALSNTTSANAYITDSAPGSSAFATGKKTKNNFVGVDIDGKPLEQLPDILARQGMVSALISTGDITDATPADFYAHTSDRDASASIIKDFLKSAVRYLIGGPTSALKNTDLKGVKIYNHLPKTFTQSKSIVVDPAASQSATDRGSWLSKAFTRVLNTLKAEPNGFFIMAEASQTDIYAHANDFPKVVKEVLDFDQTVGEALRFADQDGQTLVIVLGDHETGGLSLLEGDIRSGWVYGNYSTNDHTPLPASVFAYGPGSQYFRGFFENTEIFNKILLSLKK